jgi:hypothetical protein
MLQAILIKTSTAIMRTKFTTASIDTVHVEESPVVDTRHVELL